MLSKLVLDIHFCVTFKYSFDIFLEKDVFPDKMKIVELTPILKSGDLTSTN